MSAPENSAVDEATIRAKMAEFLSVAKSQVVAELPKE